MGNTALLRGIDGRDGRGQQESRATHHAIEEIDGDDDVEVAEREGGHTQHADGRIDRQTGWCQASMRRILSLPICFTLIRFNNNSNQRDLVIEV